MRYPDTATAVFLDRPNRFIAHVDLLGTEKTVHVKNTGRCRELLIPGRQVILSRSGNPSRKTEYDLIAVNKTGLGWVNIDSQAPNTVVKEWLEKGPSLFPGISGLKPEYTYGRSRVDFFFRYGSKKVLMEVKGCTLEVNGTGYFPDAPTERGVKHLNELAGAVREGYECYLAFVIAMPGIKTVLPNTDTHPEFGTALDAAVKAGVHVLYLPCRVEPDILEVEYV